VLAHAVDDAKLAHALSLRDGLGIAGHGARAPNDDELLVIDPNAPRLILLRRVPFCARTWEWRGDHKADAYLLVKGICLLA
jgi:hypothetical protein